MYHKIKLSARMIRRIFNFYPPFLGAGIHITHIADDFMSARVKMKLSLRNKNYVGTHFGGSLYAMTDPFYMLLLMNVIGSDYIVWDKAAAIEFKSPGRGTVYAEFILTPARVAEIKHATDTTGKHEPKFTVDVKDTAGKLVARVEKTLYVRRKVKDNGQSASRQ